MQAYKLHWGRIVRVRHARQQEKRLSKDELAAMAERLCKPKVPPPPQKRVRAVKLVYQREKGSKTYIPKLVPAKKVCIVISPLQPLHRSACMQVHDPTSHRGTTMAQKS